jgi:S1-C subfamily serine protease
MTLRTALIAASLSLCSGPAAAEYTVVDKIDGWEIGYDNEFAAGACLAFFSYQGGTTLRLVQSYRTNTNEPVWGIILRNEKWTWSSDRPYDMTIDSMGPYGRLKQRWSVTFNGGHSSLVVFGLSVDLMNSLAMDSDGSFRVWNAKDSKVLGWWNLANSAAAIRSVVRCLRARSPVMAKTPPSEKPTEKGLSYGTGFFVANGQVLTNYHVIKDCKSKPKVGYPDFRAEEAPVAATDEINDLALLRTDMRNLGVATFRLMPRLGEQVASFGFPYGRQMSTSGNFTLGNVTSVVGVGDNTGQFQVSAPLQPGNSGGPLLDGSGRVLGVSQLVFGTLKMAQSQGGAVPQNVNFAISAAVAVNFLNVKGVNPKIDLTPTEKLEPEVLAEAAKRFTVQVYCD